MSLAVFPHRIRGQAADQASRGDAVDPLTHAAVSTYSPTEDNQYSSILHTGVVHAAGYAETAAAVTVNGAAANRLGEWYPLFLSAGNSGANAFTVPLQIEAVLNGVTSTATQTALALPATESPLYDSAGQLMEDALWTYQWDAEHRLIGMVSKLPRPDGSLTELAFAYDFQGRRIRKQVWQRLSLSNRIMEAETLYAYEGWNLVLEVDTMAGGIVTHQYLWGHDLSGQGQGAGGVGGLLTVEKLTGSAVGTYFPSYDGNGNIIGLTAGTSGTSGSGFSAGEEVARFTYDAFGGRLTATSPAATVPTFGFSTKYTDQESGLLYYSYRYLDPRSGRWLSRDPIEERGGINLYGMVGNDAVARVDVLGRDWWDDIRPTPRPGDDETWPYGREEPYIPPDLPGGLDQTILGDNRGAFLYSYGFERRFPNLIRELTKMAKAAVGKSICQYARQESGNLSDGQGWYKNILNGTVHTAETPSETVLDGEFGDKTQGYSEYRTLIGAARMRVDGSTISYRRTSAPVSMNFYSESPCGTAKSCDISDKICKKGCRIYRYEWKAEMALYDQTGIDSSDGLLVLFKPIAPHNSNVKRASYYLYGNTYCKRCNP